MVEAAPTVESWPLEERLLGTVLSSPDAFRAVVTVARPEHFSRPLNAMLYETIIGQADAGRGFDATGLMAALRLVWNDKVREDQTVGQYVAWLMSNSAPPTFALRMAQDLRDLWAMRQILDAARRPSIEDGRPLRDQLSEVLDTVDTVRAGLVDRVGTKASAGMATAATLATIKRVVEDGEVIESGATTGFVDVDRMMLGYRPGELVIVAARPGMGKTTWATSSLLASAKKRNGVVLFSLELPEEAVSARILADLAHDARHPLTHSAIRDNRVPQSELLRLEEAVRAAEALPFELDFATRLSVAEIGIRIAALRKKMEVRVVAIDYLKFLKATDRYKGQRVYEVGEITAGLKEIAKEQGVCIVLLCQLNRGVEGQSDKRPDLQHLRESGDIESDADVVMFLYREAYYIERSPEYRAGNVDAQAEFSAARTKLECIIAKNRNGPCGTVELYCDIGSSAIRNAQRMAMRGVA